MKRRTVLSGTGIGVVTSLSGCLETIGDTDGTGDPSPPTTACEAGRTVIEAIDEGDYDRAADVAPAAFDDRFEAEEIRARYEDLATPDAIHIAECAEERAAEDVVTEFSESYDVEATEAAQLEYSLELTIGPANLETTTRVRAVKIDDEWTAWLDETLLPEPTNVAVDVQRDGSTAATVTVTDKPEAVVLFITGEGINDPSRYRLGDVGETITVRSDDVGSGTFSVIATYDAADETPRTEVTDFELVDPDKWDSVDEIVFSAKTVAWEVTAPESLSGLENPTLVLEAGREYRIGWDSGDGAAHNLEIRDDNDTVVDSYETEITAEPDAEQFLTITATAEMATYRCLPHPSMSGDIEIVESI